MGHSIAHSSRGLHPVNLQGCGIGPFQPWMEMLISKVATDFKVIRSECEMIQSSTRGLEVWFGRGTVREVIRERRTGF